MADDNKPIKYARYAVGEIILVVIGILIALQINTWKEGRKEKEKGLLAKHHAFEQLLDLYFYMDSFGTEIKEKSKATIELLKGKQ